MIYLSPKNFVSIREGAFKLIVPANTGRKQLQEKTIPPYELYNLVNDPSEKNNIAETKPEIVTKMFARLKTIVESGRSTTGAS